MSRVALLNTLLILSAVCAASEDLTLVVGDGQIDGNALQPYRLTWQQCSLQDDAWQNQGELTEELVVIGDDMLRHRQSAQQQSGVTTVATSYLDRRSLAPLRVENHASKDGQTLAAVWYQLGDNGYTGHATRGDESTPKQGSINSSMLLGTAMGLPLATLGPRTEPVTFLASMLGFDASYEVTVDWVGTEDFEYAGQNVTASLVDVHWLHRESGDVYAPGPAASGGRYWLVQNPPAGFPYVPRYQTDSYAVEFMPGACPVDGQ